MIETSDLSQFREPGALRDGTPLLIRTARADDRQRIVAAFEKLDAQTIYTRYFSPRKNLSETELKRLDAPDFERFVMLVATVGSGVDETVIAGALCVVLENTGPERAAEVAFTVEEDYQRQGLAGKLLAAITGITRGRGISLLEADVLAENVAMLSVFKRCGLPMTTSRSGGVVHLVLRLTPEAPAQAGAGKR
jgi:GNAT superfamily N-acetyltransferase